MAQFKAGDPDPTPNEWHEGSALCTSVGPVDTVDTRFGCTWFMDDHPDQHVAGAGHSIAAVWPVELVTTTEWGLQRDPGGLIYGPHKEEPEAMEGHTIVKRQVGPWTPA